MKCQILFSRKYKKNIINLSSAECAYSMVNANNLERDIKPQIQKRKKKKKKKKECVHVSRHPTEPLKAYLLEPSIFPKKAP